MNKVEDLIEKLHLTKDALILEELNKMGISVSFMLDGIRWSYK